MNHYDIVIVGGGLVGSAMARALHKLPLRLALLDRTSLTPDQPAPSPQRVSAITQASQRFLSALNAWPENHQFGCFRHMRVWRKTIEQAIAFDADAIGQSQLGWMVLNHHLQNSLLRSLQLQDNLDCWPHQTIDTIEPMDHGWQITTNQQVFQTRLLIGADGGRSLVRQQAGIAWHRHDYQQQGIVTTLHCEKPHQQCAWQRFTHQGPVALLPLADPHQCSLVWSVPTTKAKALLALNKADFSQALSATSQYQLGQLTPQESLGAFPLQRGHAQRYWQNYLALIGDAAHTIHPLAGQGVNLGFMDAATLAECLLAAGPDGFCHPAVLRRYQRWRYHQNQLIMHSMDAFHQLFTQSPRFIGRLAGQGMGWLNYTPWLKNQIIRQAMGLSGDLPTLAR